MDVLAQLHERVDALLQRYAAMRTENRALQATVASQDEIIRGLQGQVETLTQQLRDRQLAAALTPEEKAPLRDHLDGVIRDIDKILSAIHA